MRDESFGRRAILQVRWGPMAFRKAILEPGQILRVGRDEAMDLALPHDPQLAGAHFELAWDGTNCRLIDLKTSTGTLLDGTPLKEGMVSHGSWIRAGGTDMVVHFEQETISTAKESEAPSHQDNQFLPQALSLLSEQTGLHAVVDAARSDRILALLQKSPDEHHSLYEGPQGAALEDVAPYLVRLQTGSSLLSLLLQEGWKNHWGIYLTSPAPFTEIRRHLRKLLMIEMEGETGRFYFRFYDPRVLRTFLPTCTAELRKDLFGPITRFFYESNDSSCVVTATP